MKFTTFIFSLIIIFTMSVSISAQAKLDIPSKDVQIKIALKAAPAGQADGAKVLGYDKDGSLVVLREGQNDLICLGDNPNKTNIHVACYFKELEPFMARGRELKAEGKTTKELRKIRGEEAADGKLALPEKPASLFIFDADQSAVDITNGEISEGRSRSVIYVPYLTGEESGLPIKPVGGGMPWLMDAGTHRAHIMITPGK